MSPDTYIATRTATVGDIEIAYGEAGSGAPIVLVHGLAEDKDSWAEQQKSLDSVHTFAVDLRGHGQTTLGQAEGTLEQLGNDLIGFLEGVTGPAVVVGFSLGGTIALWAAAERPDLVLRLVVLGTSSVVGRSAAGFYANRIEEARTPESVTFREAVSDDTAAALAVAHDRLDDVVSHRLGAIGDGGGYINAARAMARLSESPLTPRLNEISMHVDVVGATADTFCPRKAADIILAALNDATYHEIADAGHLMNIDNSQGVTDLLRTTLIERN